MLKVASAFLLLSLVASPALCGTKTTTIYGHNGEVVAKIRDNGTTAQVWDAKGHYQGRVTHNPDGSDTAWGRDGKWLGHSTTTGGEDHDQEAEDGQE